MTTKSVTIKTQKVGTNFGVCAVVYSGREKLHVTDTYAHGSESAAIDAAEEWADQHSYLTQRGAQALASARIEYSRTVDASVRNPAADARRVLTNEHCSLASAIQDFERNRGFENLENVTAECRRTREMWT